MAPIRKGDGTPLDIPGVQEVRSGDGRVFFEGDAIPDSRVSRPDDNTTLDRDSQYGLAFSVDDEWDIEMDARISNQTSGATRAYLYDATGDTLIDDVDISELSSGDIVTFSLLEPLDPAKEYTLVADAEGSNATFGGYDDAVFPYTSNDGILSIIDGALDSRVGQSISPWTFVEIGNLS